MTERELLVQEEMALTVAVAALSEASGAAYELGIADSHQGLVTKLGALRQRLRDRFARLSGDK
jgi:hypothetical protein